MTRLESLVRIAILPEGHSIIVNSKYRINVLLLVLPLCFITACSTTPKTHNQQTTQASTTAVSDMTTAQMITEAERSSEPRSSQLYLYAASQLIHSDSQKAYELLGKVSPQTFTGPSYSNAYFLLYAQAASLIGQHKEAKEWLQNLTPDQLSANEKTSYYSILAKVDYDQELYEDAIDSIAQIISQADVDPSLYTELWAAFMAVSPQKLQQLQTMSSSEELKAWAELADIYRTPDELSRQQVKLEKWRERWKHSNVIAHIPEDLQNRETIEAYEPKRIAIMLPLSGSQASVGNAVRHGMMTGYYQTMAKTGSTADALPELMFYDTESQNPAVLLAEVQAQGADMIIGPLRRSMATTAINSNVKVNVPWLILNQATDTKLGKHIFQFSLSSENEAELAAQRAWQDGYRNPLILTADSEWGERVAKSFVDEWVVLGGDTSRVYKFKHQGDYNTATSEALLVNNSFKRANNLSRALGQSVEYTPRRRQDIDMVFMAASAAQGRQLKPALDFYFAYDLPVYTVSNMYSGQPNPTQDRDLNNIRIPLMPWLSERSSTKTAIENNWPESKGPLAPLFAMGIDIWRIYPALAQMANTPSAHIEGSTGTLTLTNDGDINRELQWLYFRDGRPVPLSQKESRNPNPNAYVLAK